MSKSLNKYLDINYLQKHCTKIHAFGLGFIQIKLGEKERVHVYTPEVTLTSDEEEIHNHRYDFKSTVLKGSLKNKIYKISPSDKGTFTLVDEACNPDVPKSKNQILVLKPLLISEFTTTANYSYFLDKDTFHQVQAEKGTITLVERGPVIKDMAQIVFSNKQIPTCPFSVNLEESQLWDIVRSHL